jgi:hypothetical protein
MTEQQPKKGDIIQTGLIFGNGDGSIQWFSHQIIRRISSDGTIWYRPREAKVDKTPQYWKFPVEPREEIIKDLLCYANPVEGKEAIKRLMESSP